MSKRRDDERTEKIVRSLQKLPENKKCINCDSVGPQYVCTNFATFVCTTCCGIHREFTHRVKSVSMSQFTAEEAAALQAGGNERGRQLYLNSYDLSRRRLPDNSDPELLRDFIRAVYIDRRYMGEKPSPGRADIQESRSDVPTATIPTAATSSWRGTSPGDRQSDYRPGGIDRFDDRSRALDKGGRDAAPSSLRQSREGLPAPPRATEEGGGGERGTRDDSSGREREGGGRGGSNEREEDREGDGGDDLDTRRAERDVGKDEDAYGTEREFRGGLEGARGSGGSSRDVGRSSREGPLRRFFSRRKEKNRDVGGGRGGDSRDSRDGERDRDSSGSQRSSRYGADADRDRQAWESHVQRDRKGGNDPPGRSPSEEDRPRGRGGRRGWRNRGANEHGDSNGRYGAADESYSRSPGSTGGTDESPGSVNRRGVGAKDGPPSGEEMADHMPPQPPVLKPVGAPEPPPPPPPLPEPASLIDFSIDSGPAVPPPAPQAPAPVLDLFGEQTVPLPAATNGPTSGDGGWALFDGTAAAAGAALPTLHQGPVQGQPLPAGTAPTQQLFGGAFPPPAGQSAGYGYQPGAESGPPAGAFPGAPPPPAGPQGNHVLAAAAAPQLMQKWDPFGAPPPAPAPLPAYGQPPLPPPPQSQQPLAYHGSPYPPPQPQFPGGAFPQPQQFQQPFGQLATGPGVQPPQQQMPPPPQQQQQQQEQQQAGPAVQPSSQTGPNPPPPGGAGRAVRQEIPEDLFAQPFQPQPTYQNVAYLGGYAAASGGGGQDPAQYVPTSLGAAVRSGAMPAYAQPPKSKNPFDDDEEEGGGGVVQAPAQPTFPGMASLQGALPPNGEPTSLPAQYGAQGGVPDNSGFPSWAVPGQPVSASYPPQPGHPGVAQQMQRPVPGGSPPISPQFGADAPAGSQPGAAPPGPAGQVPQAPLIAATIDSFSSAPSSFGPGSVGGAGPGSATAPLADLLSADPFSMLPGLPSGGGAVAVGQGGGMQAGGFHSGPGSKSGNPFG